MFALLVQRKSLEIVAKKDAVVYEDKVRFQVLKVLVSHQKGKCDSMKVWSSDILMGQRLAD